MNTLRELAAALKEKGYTVYTWKSIYYKNGDDFNSVMYGKDGENGVVSISRDDLYGLCVTRKYVPSQKNGSGCMIERGVDFDTILASAEMYRTAALPKWLDMGDGMPKEYRDINHYADTNNKKWGWCTPYEKF